MQEPTSRITHRIRRGGRERVDARPTPCTLGWSDLALFWIFETFTLLSIRFIFRSSIPKNGQFRPRGRIAHAAKFSFSKNHRDLKINLFFFICRNLPCSMYIKEQSQKITFLINICLIFFY